MLRWKYKKGMYHVNMSKMSYVVYLFRHVQVIWGWLHKPLVCHPCDATHKITISGRTIFALPTVLPMLIFVHFLTPFHPIF